MRRTDHASLKLTEANTIRLLQLYRAEPCLYDINAEDYRARKCRIAAMKRIAAALNVDGFGPKEVAIKFKNLRNSYSQELKKIKDNEMSRAPGEEIYVPKVYWFHVMDSFLRPHLYSRNGQPSMMLKHKLITHTAVKTERPEYVDDDDDEYEYGISSPKEKTMPSLIPPDEIQTLSSFNINMIKKEAEDGPSHSSRQGTTREEVFSEPVVIKDRGMKRRRIDPPQESTSSIRESDGSSTADKLYEMSQLAATMVSKQSDIHSHFGDYVASVLRETGGQKALLIQQDICSVIFKHLSGLSSPSGPSRVPSASPCETSSHVSLQDDTYYDSN